MDLARLLRDLRQGRQAALRYRWRKLRTVAGRRAADAWPDALRGAGWPESIPVIINNRNRLTYLRQIIAWLERAGMRRIHILDNASTYPPLLEYYRTTPHDVIRLDRNAGCYALWQTGAFERFRRGYYIYTDPDVLPDAACPPDWLDRFLFLLRKYRTVDKVGFGLRVDDLPPHYRHHREVARWERQFWQEPVEPDVFRAKIDTTFALYRPRAQGGFSVEALRTGGPYVARHLPWYEDSALPTAENQYYADHAEGVISNWSIRADQTRSFGRE